MVNRTANWYSYRISCHSFVSFLLVVFLLEFAVLAVSITIFFGTILKELVELFSVFTPTFGTDRIVLKVFPIRTRIYED